MIFIRNDDIFGDFESAPAAPAAAQEPAQAAVASGKKTNADILSLYGAAPQANNQFGGANNQFGGAFGAMSQPIPQQQNFGAFGGMTQQQPQQTSNASNLDILGKSQENRSKFTCFRRFRKPDDTSTTNTGSFHGG